MIKLTALLFFISLSGYASACEQYNSIPMEELKEYRDKLIEAGADPFDRLFAFEKLVCSDKPTIRSFAIEAGMKSASDDIIRHEILLQAILQRKQIVVELISTNANKNQKKYIDRMGGALLVTVRGKFPEEGCVSWTNEDKCEGWFLHISGGKATLNGNGYDGFFELSETGQLLGYVRYSGVRIPAKIPLN